ncbi:unnamed protein product, partial [Rotaria magnacalcarata]
VISNNLDELQQRNPSSTFQINKRKFSVRKILKTPARRLSLKDNSTSKDVKTPDQQDLITNSASIISADSGNYISANKREPLSSDSSISRKIKAFTFINTEDSASTPNNMNTMNKSIGNGNVNDIYSMTESSHSPSSSSSSSTTTMTIRSPRNNVENDIIEIPSSVVIQSQHVSSPDTNIDSSLVTAIDKDTIAYIKLNNSNNNNNDTALVQFVRKLVNTLALDSSRDRSGDLSSRLRKTRAPLLTSISPIEDDSVIARLVQHVAPINIVSGLSASDFQIPTPLSVTTPTVDDNSTISMPSSSSSSSSSTITVIPNDSPSELTDEISLNDADQTTLSSLTTTDEPVDPRTKYGAKRRHNIVELIETEKEYVKDLALIVEGYMNVIENDKDIKKPTGLTGRERVVFGNVQRIFEFHRDTFLPQLEQCIENPDTLGRLFTTNRFSPYVKYCENKPRSEYIVAEYHDYFEDIRKKLGQKLLVSDLLIKPVQRIMRYQLLLREILKSTERMGDEPRAIRSALQVMIEVPQQANDMMNVGRIKDLPTNVHQLGELKLQDMLSVSEPLTSKDTKDIEKKFKERRVFLFQQSMIFCDEIPAKDKYSSPNYIYKYELKINKLQHKEFKRSKEAFQFTLVEVDVGITRRVICQCKDDEQYELWVTSVNKVLQRQMDLIIGKIRPCYCLYRHLEIKLKRTVMSNQIDKTSILSTSSNSNGTIDNTKKKSSLSFCLFDSILSHSVAKPLTTKKINEKSLALSFPLSCPQSSLISNMHSSEQTRCLFNRNNYRLTMFVAILLSTIAINCVHSQTELTLPDLPYEYNALEPVLSEHLMRLHHDKHFQAYVNNTNVALQALIVDTQIHDRIKEIAKKPIEVILTHLDILPHAYQSHLRYNGGGYLNHKLFFSILKTPTATAEENKPTGPLLEAIEKAFESFDKFKDYFNAASNNFFGSGWIWVYIDANSKQITLNFSINQDNPVMYDENHVILLCIDLWEHAYYPVYENRRSEYIENFWRIINWSYVGQLYNEGQTGRSDL